MVTIRQRQQTALPQDFRLGLAVAVAMGALLFSLAVIANETAGPGPRGEARQPEGVYIEMAAAPPPTTSP